MKTIFKEYVDSKTGKTLQMMCLYCKPYLDILLCRIKDVSIKHIKTMVEPQVQISPVSQLVAVPKAVIIQLETKTFTKWHDNRAVLSFSKEDQYDDNAEWKEFDAMMMPNMPMPPK